MYFFHCPLDIQIYDRLFIQNCNRAFLQKQPIFTKKRGMAGTFLKKRHDTDKK